MVFAGQRYNSFGLTDHAPYSSRWRRIFSKTNQTLSPIPRSKARAPNGIWAPLFAKAKDQLFFKCFILLLLELSLTKARLEMQSTLPAALIACVFMNGVQSASSDDVRSANIIAEENGVECLVIDREWVIHYLEFYWHIKTMLKISLLLSLLCIYIFIRTFDQTVGTFNELQKYLQGYVATLDRDDKKRHAR